jgi:peptidyl-prolyl cis-trans isomerase D
MAVIGKIRERSTLVLVIIGLAIVAFVLTDLFSAKAGGQQGPINLAEIDGKAVSAQDFDFKVQNAYATYQTNSQSNEALDEATKASIREQVWNEVVSDLIIGNEMEILGITVTKNELMDMVSGDNPHPQIKQAFTNPETGEFNSFAVIQFLQNLDNDPAAKEQWLSFEKAIKRNQHIEKYNNLIKKGMYTPNALATAQANETNTKIDFSYVYKPFSSINDEEVTVSESDVKTYYNNNLDKYEQKASRKAYYAYFPVRASDKDIEDAKVWSEDAANRMENVEDDSIFVNRNSEVPFDANYYSVDNRPMGTDSSLWSKEIGFMKGPYMIEKTFFIQKVRNIKMAPDSVKASHILINTADRTPERAEEIADSLMILLNSGTKMADIAAENSDDVGSGQNGGDLGYFTEGTMVKPFNDAAFSSEIGDFTKVTSQFGIHLIEVTDRTELKKKIQIATVRRTSEPSKDTYENVFNEANSFSISVTDLEGFNTEVNERDIQRRVTVLSETDNLIQGEAASRDLVRWIKEAGVNDVSEAYDLDDAFVVAVVEEINQKGASPLEKVDGIVRQEVLKQVKGKMMVEEFSGATDLNSLSSKVNIPTKKASAITFTSSSIPNVGLEPAVVGKAHSLQKGQMSVPIIGNNGVFVISIDEKVEIANPDLTIVQNANARANKSKVDNGLLFNALKDKSDIVDNRSKFY